MFKKIITFQTTLLLIILTSISAGAQVTQPAPSWTKPFPSKKNTPTNKKIIVKPKQTPAEELPNVSKVEVKQEETKAVEFGAAFSTALYMQVTKQEDDSRKQYFIHSLISFC